MDTLSHPLAESYVRTVNNRNAAAFVSLFAADAVVDDAGRVFRGLDDIRAWSETDIFAAQVSLKVLDDSEQEGDALFTAEVDGTFDRTGLPDPVVITHRLATAGNKITALTCRLAQ